MRALLVFFGVLSVILAVIGIILPGLPTTPFLLLAAACFLRSSQRLYRWLLTNKLFGKYLKNYIEGKGISIWVKIFVITLLWISIGYTLIISDIHWILRGALALVAAIVTYHILRIKTYKLRNEIH